MKSNIVIIRTIKDNIISPKENMKTTVSDTPSHTKWKHP